MILDSEKYQLLISKKLQDYSNYTREVFFSKNKTSVPCSLGERAGLLYSLMEKEVSFSREDFTQSEHEEVKAFIKCFEEQMQKVIAGELEPVDMSKDEILDLIRVSDEEIESCFITKEEIYQMLKNG